MELLDKSLRMENRNKSSEMDGRDKYEVYFDKEGKSFMILKQRDGKPYFNSLKITIEDLILSGLTIENNLEMLQSLEYRKACDQNQKKEQHRYYNYESDEYYDRVPENVSRNKIMRGNKNKKGRTKFRKRIIKITHMDRDRVWKYYDHREETDNIYNDIDYENWQHHKYPYDDDNYNHEYYDSFDSFEDKEPFDFYIQCC